MKLSKRLRFVVDEIQGNTLADIGCDHGKVAVAAILEKRIERAICSDISLQSLEKARRLAKICELESNCEFRIGDGFLPYQFAEADCIVIAGMGAMEIIKILMQKDSGAKKFIFVAHKNTDKLRKYLNENKYVVQKDYIFKDGKIFYNLITAERGKAIKLSKKEMYFGRNSSINESYIEYLKKELVKQELVYSNAKREAKAVALEKIKIIKDELCI